MFDLSENLDRYANYNFIFKAVSFSVSFGWQAGKQLCG